MGLKVDLRKENAIGQLEAKNQGILVNYNLGVGRFDSVLEGHRGTLFYLLDSLSQWVLGGFSLLCDSVLFEYLPNPGFYDGRDFGL